MGCSTPECTSAPSAPGKGSPKSDRQNRMFSAQLYQLCESVPLNATTCKQQVVADILH